MKRLSVCTTNYNCAHALEKHLESVYRGLAGLDFEYIVVDNLSTDGSLNILRGWSSKHPEMITMSKRCTMGEGRQLSFEKSTGSFIMVLDTDVVYSDLLRSFTDAYFAQCSDVSVQAVYCGIFPRDQWVRAGGRNSLNTNEDVDMWFRIARLGTMRWYPVQVGENLKETSALGMYDHLSKRYSKRERILRLARREWDFFKTRRLATIDIQQLISSNLIDLGLGPAPEPWPQGRQPLGRGDRLARFVRELKQTWLTR